VVSWLKTLCNLVGGVTPFQILCFVGCASQYNHVKKNQPDAQQTVI